MNYQHSLIDPVGRAFQPIALLLLRLYVASIFLRSGIQKLDNWDSTLFLFEYQYSVPLLPPNIAAILGTTAEIGLPLLLIFGLLTRWAALALFIFNLVAVTSYAALSKGAWGLTMAFDIIPTGITFPTVGYESHVIWGMMILVLLAFGAGKISIDALLRLRQPQVGNYY